MRSFQGGAKIGESPRPASAVAERGNARTELSRGAPNAVLVLLDDVGHVNDTSHTFIMHVKSIVRPDSPGTPPETVYRYTIVPAMAVVRR